MKRKLNVTVLVVGIYFIAQSAAYADSCTSVKREMVFGEAATEDAKDKVGFKRAAEEFNKAVRKAPNCAAAFFNLGAVQEQSGEFIAAKAAFEQYLKLSPGALDASSVEKLILKLEYRISQEQAKEEGKRKKAEQTHQIGGMWKNRYGDQKFNIVMNGNSFNIYMTGYCPFGDCNRGWKKANRKDYTGTIGKNGEISGFHFVTAMLAEGLSQNKKNGVPCKVSAGWYPIIKAALSQQGRKMTIKGNIPYQNPFCGSTSTELILAR